jgi:hypothetical protein
VRLWVAYPGDAPAQRVLDFTVKQAPDGWQIVREPEYGNRYLYVEVKNPAPGNIDVVTDFTVIRDPVQIEVGASKVRALTETDRRSFAAYLTPDVPLMAATPDIKARTDEICAHPSCRISILRTRRPIDDEWSRLQRIHQHAATARAKETVQGAERSPRSFASGSVP